MSLLKKLEQKLDLSNFWFWTRWTRLISLHSCLITQLNALDIKQKTIIRLKGGKKADQLGASDLEEDKVANSPGFLFITDL